MTETIEATTEGDIRDFVTDNPDDAVHMAHIPGLVEAWFFATPQDNLAIVVNQMGEVGVSEPQGNDTDITASGDAAELDVVSMSDLPFDTDQASETIDEYREE